MLDYDAPYDEIKVSAMVTVTLSPEQAQAYADEHTNVFVSLEVRARLAAEMTEALGWGVIRPGDRKAHYYRDTMSLCRRVGFYFGPLEPDEHPSRDDCAACRKALAKEAAKSNPAGAAVTIKER